MTTLQLVLRTIAGKAVPVPDPSVRFVHLQFRRFAGCPICNTHLRSFAKRRRELAEAGVREVIFFHSSAEELRTYEADLPFDLVADPEKRFYRQFGVESSSAALLHPAIVGAAIRGAKVVFRGNARRLWIPKAENGRLGLPADFLVDAAGRIAAARHGRHANDQWEVDEVLELAGPGVRKNAGRQTGADGLAPAVGFRGEASS
ncbi:MAG TPA: peroxiredoxin-like family protein [Opitutus sp.]|nr:peroxiredoxin-like family protein [Opitutus sp.]